MRQHVRSTLAFLLLLVVAVSQPAIGHQTRVADPQEARTVALDAELPFDPDVRFGTFANGLTYFIRANKRPENRAELRLVVDAGSVLEDDDQLGMAHLLEHMAFNGTERFEKQELVEFMESIGMRLGPDVNAYTSFDETVYMLQVPTDNPEHISTAFQIMEDWTKAITLDGDEIDAERGIVIEEWRLGQGASARVNDEQFPIIFKDSQYAERLPIGTEESIQTASVDSIRRFYEDWYRPDLMAVIVIGDFDPDVIEDLVSLHFEGLPRPTDPRPRILFEVPDQVGTDFAIATDPELPNTSVGVFYKMQLDSEGTVRDYRRSLVEGLYNSMLNARFAELTQQADPPISIGASGKGAMVRTKAMYQLFAGVAPNGIERGLDTLFSEAARVAQFGFTQTELDRMKANMLRGIQRAYDDRANRSSSVFVNEYTRAYLESESFPGLEYEFELVQRFLPEITLSEVNAIGRDWIKDSNRVVLVSAPEIEDVVIPSEVELLAVIDAAGDKELTAYEDTVAGSKLLPVTPNPGSIIAVSMVDEVGVTEWTLSNGARVILKPTDLRDDEIIFGAFSPGGTSLATIENYIPASTASAVMNISGLGEFNLIDLDKIMAGKAAWVSSSITEFSEGLAGQASPKDLETLFQLIYLRFTSPRADSVALEAYLAQGRSVLANQEATPDFQLQKKTMEVRWQDHPRRQAQTVESLDEWDLERSYDFYRDRFAEASDFTFMFIGNLDLEMMRPFVEQYIASLPSIGREETWLDVGVRHVDGVVVEEVRAGIEQQSQTSIYFSGPFVYEQQPKTSLRAMAQILQTRLRDIMREDLGGTYGVGVSTNYGWQPFEKYSLTIGYGSDPERAEELVNVVFAEIEKLKEAPPEEGEVADVRENLTRTLETSLESNAYWMNQLSQYYRLGVNPASMLQYPPSIDALTPKMIQDAAQLYLDTDNYLRMTLLPVEQYQEN